MTYKPPQIPHGLSSDTLADEYTSDYRRVYIEHPRLRLDGVYIAICHYVCVHYCHLYQLLSPSLKATCVSKQTGRAERKCLGQCRFPYDSEK
jgi:hypothetical protein